MRPTVAGTRHAVVTGHPLAAQAGFQILEAGGNAVDAGVAAGIAMAVLHPDQVNFAGVAPMLIYVAQRDEVIAIDGLGVWPKRADRQLFAREHGGRVPPGLLRTVVPAAPGAWLAALERYGTMRFGELAAPAIRFAREGFPMYAYLAKRIGEREMQYRRWPQNEAIYLPQGQVPRPGELFVQTDLARSLQYMADQERSAKSPDRRGGLAAARAAFYNGDIGKAIADYHRVNGGWLTEEDLAGFRVSMEKPLQIEAFGLQVFACGPWCQGPALLQLLRLLERYDLRAMGHNSPEYLHTLIEAVKLVFADREAYYGDPRFVDVPTDALISAEYAARRAADLHPDRAWPQMPPPGDPRNTGTRKAWDWRISAASGEPPLPADTTQVCVVDRHGTVFSATPSDVSYESPVIPGTGLCPSSRGTQSWVDPRHPSCLAPGKRPRLTPNPCLAMRKGERVMPFGTPGGDVQVQANLQVFLNIVLFGMDTQLAVEAARFVSYGHPDSFEPHAYYPGRVNLEARIPRATGDWLMQRGHKLQWYGDFTDRCGGVCVIDSDLRRSLHQCGADPRRAAYAAAW
jgi:gamma-glutamyltranspeptidase/glutathione hydrolase